MKLGFLGVGTIATAVVKGVADHGHQILLSERNALKAKQLSERYDNVSIAPNQAVIDVSDVIFIGLMPDVAEAILPDLQFKSGQIIISFIADLTLEQIAAMVAPAEAKALMLPYPNIADGNSIIPFIGDRAVIESLFAAKNHLTMLQNQDEMNALLRAQAVLSPVAKLVQDAANWLDDKGVETERGERFLRILIASNLFQIPSDTLLEALNTEGGYNQRLRLHMEKSGISEMLKTGLDEL